MIGLIPVKEFVNIFSILIHYRFSQVTLIKLSTCVVAIVCKSFFTEQNYAHKTYFQRGEGVYS